MPHAPTPTRAYESAMLSFGLVNVPLDVFSGTVSDHGISRKMLHVVPVMEDVEVDVQQEDGTVEKGVVKQHKTVQHADPVSGEVHEIPVFEDHPVGYNTVDKITGETLARTAITKKIETEYGPVYVEDHEIEALFQANPRTIRVLTFQPQFLFAQGYYVPKNLYYVAPGRTQVGKKKQVLPATATAFTILLTAMRKRNAMAVCEFTTRGIPKPCILLPDGTLWEVRHTEEVRDRLTYPEVEVPDAVIEQAGTLIDTLWSTTPTDLTDERTALIQAFADEKARAGDFGKPEEPEEVTEVVAPATDFMAMLSASVDAIKAQQAQAG